MPGTLAKSIRYSRKTLREFVISRLFIGLSRAPLRVRRWDKVQTYSHDALQGPQSADGPILKLKKIGFFMAAIAHSLGALGPRHGSLSLQKPSYMRPEMHRGDAKTNECLHGREEWRHMAILNPHCKFTWILLCMS